MRFESRKNVGDATNQTFSCFTGCILLTKQIKITVHLRKVSNRKDQKRSKQRINARQRKKLYRKMKTLKQTLIISEIRGKKYTKKKKDSMLL